MPFRDLAGQQFNRLTVLRRHPENTVAGKARWVCWCVCRRETTVVGGSLRSGRTTSCGCSNKERLALGSALDLTGQRFGRLTVTRRHPHNTAADKARWVCLCDCGQETVSVAGNLRSGHKLSCGCAHREHLESGAASKTHGLSRTPEHNRWKAMIKRCYNPNDSSYARYGGRGVTVCDTWRNHFEAFLADMGTIPSPRHSIERRDNSEGYSPENCYWATPLQQARNTSRNRLLTFQGETKPLSEWCDRLGLKYQVVFSRIHSYGWTVEDALTIPAGRRRPETHCRNGHAWSESNTRRIRNTRVCRQCERDSDARARTRKQGLRI